MSEPAHRHWMGPDLRSGRVFKCPATVHLGHSLPRLPALAPPDVRFSNRPVGVKHFQAIHRFGANVAHGLVLLFGIGTKALPSWDPRMRRNNLLGGLAVSRTAGSSDQANSPHPSSREGHLSTAGWTQFPPII